jgi:anaerobic selenocysteine-containing dehydrogenase
MSENISRRAFLKKVGAAAAVGGATGLAKAAPAAAASTDDNMGILVDLTKCDGCSDVPVPRCVTACQAEKSGPVS